MTTSNLSSAVMKHVQHVCDLIAVRNVELLRALGEVRTDDAYLSTSDKSRAGRASQRRPHREGGRRHAAVASAAGRGAGGGARSSPDATASTRRARRYLPQRVKTRSGPAGSPRRVRDGVGLGRGVRAACRVRTRTSRGART